MMAREELLVSHRAPPLVAERGMLTRYGGYREIKYLGRTKTSTAALQSDTGVSRARGRKPSSKIPGPPGWGLMQQASPLLIAKKTNTC